LRQADLTPSANAPAKLDNVNDSFRALENAIYGPFTAPTIFELQSSDTLKENWLNDKATVERRVYSVSHGQSPQDLEVVFVKPKNAPNGSLIISQNFSHKTSHLSPRLSPLMAYQQFPETN